MNGEIPETELYEKVDGLTDEHQEQLMGVLQALAFAQNIQEEDKRGLNQEGL